MHEILAIRQSVFVLEQQCFYLDADEFDPCSWHLVGRDNAGAIATYARLCFPQFSSCRNALQRRRHSPYCYGHLGFFDNT